MGDKTKMSVSLVVAKRRWDTSYRAVSLAHRGSHWGFWYPILMGPPLGRPGPLVIDLVRTEGEVGNVQGWKSLLGVSEHTQ